MITPTMIVKHLKTYLPIFTDLFTEKLAINSAAMDADNSLLVGTATAHGLTAGELIVVTGGTVQNEILTASLFGNEVTLSTSSDHDLVLPHQPLDDFFVTLTGFGAPWDGDHEIIGVNNRVSFSIELPVGEISAPTITGSEFQLMKVPTGVYPIATVPDVGSLTLDLSSAPSLPIGDVLDLSIISGFRIYAAADYTRALAAYAKIDSGEPALFVIMTDTDVSKDRHTMNDGVAGFTAQDDNFLRILQSFSTTVFIPTANDIAGVVAQELAYGEIFTSLLSTLFGFSVEGGKVPYKNVPSGMGPGGYNTAFYTHVYDWQLPDVIDFEDGLLDIRDAAFRDIVETFELFNDDAASMLLSIRLDEA